MKFSALLSCTILLLAVSQTLADEESAKEKYPNLPDFEYNLTQEPLSKRKNICEANVQHCVTQCGGPDEAPMKFCNPKTMGWGCGCLTKEPDYEGWQWPVNQEHCVGSGTACQQACTKLPVNKQNSCQVDCSEYWRCMGEDQPPAYYKVNDVDEVPTYKPPEKNKSDDSSSSDDKEEDDSSSSDKANDDKSGAAPLGSGYTFMYAVLPLVAGMASICIV